VKNPKRERAKSKIVEEIETVLEFEHKTVVNVKLFYNAVLVLTRQARHNFNERTSRNVLWCSDVCTSDAAQDNSGVILVCDHPTGQ